MQLKMLLNQFNDIFASENEFGRTDIIQHQIKTRDAMPIKQRTYRMPPRQLSNSMNTGLFDAFGRNKWFLTLDLDNSYWQVAMDPADKEKMEFTTREGNFELK
ncbi:hypothetical protein G9A89_015698 [Geosiphon pyriformis]|nr:hypothetical protein G9A89_015698 [Geosiphon pyriformis]